MPIKLWSVKVSAVIFGTCTEWHLCVFSSKMTVRLMALVRSLFPSHMCWWEQPVELWLLTLGILRYQGIELVSYRFLLFCLVLNCGMGCMNLYMLMKAWVLLKFQSIAFSFKIGCQLFLPALRLFIFHLSFPQDQR